jgi:hemerythrin-like domain-containing protein
MPHHMGPIAVMLMEHETTRKIATRMDTSAKEYLQAGSSQKLISDIQEYIEHVTQHIWKENNRLFVMAEMRLQGNSEQVSKSLNEIEKQKLSGLGKSRDDYEKLARDLEQNIAKVT